MWENIIDNCKVCGIPIYDDESYEQTGEYIFEGIICEECMEKRKRESDCENVR